MRIYLSSYRLGDHVEELFKLLSGGRRAAIIGNALDLIPEASRREYEAKVYDPKKEFLDLGIEAEDFDLRNYFGNSQALSGDLERYDLVWVLGGNAFLLRRAFQQSGFANVIRQKLDRDDIVYGGFSAGAVVATPTLQGIDLMDDPLQLAEGYLPDIIWDGLGLVNFSIVPHYRSDHAEAALAEDAAAYLRKEGISFRPIQDGDVIVVNGEDVTHHART